MTDPPVVYVVDDDQGFRDSLVWLLESAGYSVSPSSGAEEFLECYEGQCGCLLLDVRMSGMSGLSLQRELKQRDHTLPVIIITGHGDIAMAVQAMKDGAMDFIEKPFDDELLLAQVASAVNQAQLKRDDRNSRRASASALKRLTGRERQVIDLVAQGLKNREIAEQLGITVKTVEVHRGRAMHKLGARNLAGLFSGGIVAGG